MVGMPRPELVIIGDDLSGSAEAGAVFARRGYQVRIGLGSVPGCGAIRVVDVDTRQVTAERARGRTAEVIGEAGAGSVVLKLDSLLRGQLVAQLEALAAGGHPVMFTPALPVQGRVVVGGIAYDRGRVIGGRPLKELLAPLPIASIPLVADVAALAERIAAETGRGRIAVCDAAEDRDLDRVVEAASRLPGVRLAGAAGLIAAVARRLPPGPGMLSGIEPAEAVLYVLGTAASIARDQVDALTTAAPRIEVWTRPTGDWTPGTAAAICDYLTRRRSAVLRLPVPDGPAVEDAALAAELAELTVRAAPDPAIPLVLSGGQTARAVLDRLGVTTLDVTAEIHHGAVALRTGDGRTVVTRPGSFGAADSLLRIHDHLTSPGSGASRIAYQESSVSPTP